MELTSGTRLGPYEVIETIGAGGLGGFYAIGELDGLELHLKEAPRNQEERRHRRDNDHLDASAGVDGLEAFYDQCVANEATIIKPLTATAWGTKDFYVEDPTATSFASGAGRPQTNGSFKPRPLRLDL